MLRKLTEEKVSRMEQNTKELAEKTGISDAEFETLKSQIIEAMQDKLEGRDDLDQRALICRRLDGALKKRFVMPGEPMRGFYIAKHPVVDYAKNPRKEIDEMIINQGKALALKRGICDSDANPVDYAINIETGEETFWFDGDDSLEYKEAMTEEELEAWIIEKGTQIAKLAGRVTADGKYIYQTSDFRNGKIIPEHDYNSLAYGFFAKEDEDELKFTITNIRGDAALQSLPLFQELTMPAFINKNKSDATSYTVTLLGEPREVSSEYVNFEEYIEKLDQAEPGRILGELAEIPSFVKQHKEFRSWCVVEATIYDIGLNPDGGTPVDLTDFSLCSIKAEDTLTAWLPEDIPLEFEKDMTGVIMVLSPYETKTGNITANIIGYWMDDESRSEGEIEQLNEQDIEDTWEP